ncbi:hypothetical protein [Streptomyces sp. NRRL S-337]|uniref:hypothetical protein n=1 Tax=Streptomyces sp. NRRL S-337 TaxID=1463900 RepID=UPI00131D2EB9|nr:hypothetical protein [Streptomyces sp. NRRL S-337]
MTTAECAAEVMLIALAQVPEIQLRGARPTTDLALRLSHIQIVISHKLGQDPALVRARQEAHASTPDFTRLTRLRLAQSLEEAVREDTEFAEILEMLLTELRDDARPERTAEEEVWLARAVRGVWWEEESRSQRHPLQGAPEKGVRPSEPISPPAARPTAVGAGQVEEIPEAEITEAIREPARYLNVFVARPGEEGAVFELVTSADYDLLLNIGHHLNASLLQGAEAMWPEELVPEGGVWLRASLLLEGIRESVTVPFFLPSQGESFTCGCTPGSAHRPGCARQRWIRFAMHTPEMPAVIRGELVVYYQAAAVVAVGLELPVGWPGLAPRASVIGRLSTTFNDLGKLAQRTASVLRSASAERVVVNGVGFLDNPFAIGATAADTSALNARTALFDSHAEVSGGTLRSRYDSTFGKSHAAYEQDLRRLAREGAGLYARLFSSPTGDHTVAFTLPALLRHEAQVRGRPPVLQILDDRLDEHAMLWSMVYDLPVGGDSSRYEPCPAVRAYGPEGGGGPVPPVCPWSEEHLGRGNVLCPYGFWGLSCMVEQPPTVHRDLETVVFPGPAEDIALLAAVGDSLNEHLTTTHFDRLRQGPPRCQLATATGPEVADALAPEAMDIVYFYCHCGYDVRTDTAAADRYLDLGGIRMEPLDIGMWARTVWDDPHWPRRRPLVVLNGCHTTETTSGTTQQLRARVHPAGRRLGRTGHRGDSGTGTGRLGDGRTAVPAAERRHGRGSPARYPLGHAAQGERHGAGLHRILSRQSHAAAGEGQAGVTVASSEPSASASRSAISPIALWSAPRGRPCPT